MKTMYPKDEIQKTIEIVLETGYKAAPGTYALEDFFDDFGDELLEGLCARAQFNDEFELKGDQPKLREKWSTIRDKMVLEIYKAVIEDLDFVRSDNDTLVAEVIQGT